MLPLFFWGVLCKAGSFVKRSCWVLGLLTFGVPNSMSVICGILFYYCVQLHTCLTCSHLIVLSAHTPGFTSLS